MIVLVAPGPAVAMKSAVIFRQPALAIFHSSVLAADRLAEPHIH
jgi:hypothetical protein